MILIQMDERKLIHRTYYNFSFFLYTNLNRKKAILRKLRNLILYLNLTCFSIFLKHIFPKLMNTNFFKFSDDFHLFKIYNF